MVDSGEVTMVVVAAAAAAVAQSVKRPKLRFLKEVQILWHRDATTLATTTTQLLRQLAQSATRFEPLTS